MRHSLYQCGQGKYYGHAAPPAPRWTGEVLFLIVSSYLEKGGCGVFGHTNMATLHCSLILQYYIFLWNGMLVMPYGQILC